MTPGHGSWVLWAVARVERRRARDGAHHLHLLRRSDEVYKGDVKMPGQVGSLRSDYAVDVDSIGSGDRFKRRHGKAICFDCRSDTNIPLRTTSGLDRIQVNLGHH